VSVTTWLDDIQAAIVSVLLANANLMDLARKVEAGVIDPLAQQDLLGDDFPYVGVVVTGFGTDKDELTAYKLMDVDVRIVVAAIGTPQVEVQQSVQRLLAQIDLVVGLERGTGRRFSLANTTGEISDVFPGEGRMIELMSTEDSSAFLVQGEYTFRVEYRLNITE
jgi:hypothetical protein